MISVFLDTNIIIDLIADRKPYSRFAIEIFKNAEDGKLELFASSHSIATSHYVLKKHLDEKTLREVFFNLTEYITVIAIDAGILKKGLRSKHKDFEDALQILCASSVKNIEYIVTRNPKDFKYSDVQVLTPEEFCMKL